MPEEWNTAAIERRSSIALGSHAWTRPRIHPLNLDRTNLRHRARTAAEMTHLCVFRRHHDLAITQGLHVLPMYAQTERPGTTCVRCVKSSQPGHGASV